MKYLVGIDIGGTKCAVSIGCLKENKDIAIVDKIKIETQKNLSPQHIMGVLENQVENLIAGNEIESIGISCGGPLDSKNGIILSPPNLIGWDNVKIVDYFISKFNVPVALQNDANACALAEWRFGAGFGCENMVFLTFGTGMGAGFILNGKLYTGANDMAGEVGHIRLENLGPVGYGKAGSFEGFCSGGGIAQIAKIKVLEKLQCGHKVSFCNGIDDINGISAKTVADAADNGDELATKVYRISGEYLGRGLSILIDILNPEIIVIGSIFARSQNLLWTEAEKIIKQESLILSYNACNVVPAKLAENIGDYAALAVALEAKKGELV